MNELISRVELIAEFENNNWEDSDPKDIAVQIALSAPAVEAAPVVHGKWKTIRGNFITGGGNPMWGCSKCGSWMGASLLPPKDNYCPHCGARMDGESNA